MKHDTVVLEKADKVAIAVAIAAFLVISGFLLKESADNHAHQIQKAEQAVKQAHANNAKTIDFNLQKTR